MMFNQYVLWLAQAIVALFFLRLIFRTCRWLGAKRESQNWNAVLFNSALTEDMPVESVVSPTSKVYVVLCNEMEAEGRAGFISKKCDDCGESHAMVFESCDDALDFMSALSPELQSRAFVSVLKMSDIWFNKVRIMFAGSSKHLDVVISNWDGDWDGSCARVDQQCA